jgi:hypothetical protein
VVTLPLPFGDRRGRRAGDAERDLRHDKLGLRDEGPARAFVLVLNHDLAEKSISRRIADPRAALERPGDLDRRLEEASVAAETLSSEGAQRASAEGIDPAAYAGPPCDRELPKVSAIRFSARSSWSRSSARSGHKLSARVPP